LSWEYLLQTDRMEESIKVLVKSADEILEELEDVDETKCREAMEALELLGMLVRCDVGDDDRVYYKARDGLSWSDVVHIDCPVKKQVVLKLIKNPQTFFILYNTQKGKLRIAAMEIRGWSRHAEKKIVAFLFVDNDKTLADQTAEGALEVLADVADMCVLSSNMSEKVENICTKIDSYAAFGGKMPLIVALNNAKQRKKVVDIVKHIHLRRKTPQGKNLLYGFMFDEADKVYPACREGFKPFLVDDNQALHRLGFVSATEGELFNTSADGDLYPECSNAHSQEVPPTDPNYRAIHTCDVEIKCNRHKVKDSNDVYAEEIIANNRDYFANPIVLKNGSYAFRKTIVNGGAKTESMVTFALNRVNHGNYAMTVNMHGVCLYRPGHNMVKKSTKGRRFGDLMFSMYKEYNLHDRPLFIIGRRKVDRGVGFHYAPREKLVDGNIIGPDEGLIWTDMILGRVDDKDNAVQKAGRLAGIVAQSPQYPGKLTWWTDDETANRIVRHNTVVDKTANKVGCSALQAMSRAEAEEDTKTKKVDEEKLKHYRIYEFEADVRSACKILGYHYIPTKDNCDGFKETSLNTKKCVVSLKDAVDKVKSAYGTNNGMKTYRTYYPCYVDSSDKTTLRFVVIIRPGTDNAKVADCDRLHHSI
jgi:hypothetical protein